jgi:2,3-bisphosphoglycerate-independent phosphoglycerate mutase
MSKKTGPIALIVIDGWGYSASRDGNAIALAKTPFYDELCEKYPGTLLEAHGARVGLPAGVMGNSEVGHLNIGSGRVIRMDVSRVDHEIETGDFFQKLCTRERYGESGASTESASSDGLDLRWTGAFVSHPSVCAPRDG